MEKGSRVFVVTTMLLSFVFLGHALWAGDNGVKKPLREDVWQKTMKLQMPFITNEGQTDEEVKFYASTLRGGLSPAIGKLLFQIRDIFFVFNGS